MKTSQHQFDILVTFMEEHGDLSKPNTNARGRVASMQKWEELTSLLNSDGNSDTKTTEKWKKVWSDFKNNIKKKAARIHRAAHGTGGGPAILTKLTDLEQRVLNLIGVQVATGLGIVEVGFSKADASGEALVSQTQNDVEQDRDAIESVGEPGPSRVFYSQPSIEVLVEPRSPNQAHSMETPLSRPVVSPPSIVFNEEPIENIENLDSSQAVSPPQSQPAPFGQTTPRRVRSLQSRLSPCNLQSPRRRVRSQGRQLEVAHHFLQADAEWRRLRLQQQRDSIDRRREENRLRELEIQMQRDWQAIGIRALDILDKLVTKFCRD